MTTPVADMTVEEFDRIAMLPENKDRRLQFIGGELVEVVSNGLSSIIAGVVCTFLNNLVISRKLGFVSGPDCGYCVAGDRYVPNIGYISRKRQPQPWLEGYNPLPPDLAVEILSPSNSADDVRIKVGNYLSAGTVTWVVDPKKKLVEVYAPSKSVQVFRSGGLIDGGEVLPGFSLKVDDIFEPLN